MLFGSTALTLFSCADRVVAVLSAVYSPSWSVAFGEEHSEAFPRRGETLKVIFMFWECGAGGFGTVDSIMQNCSPGGGSGGPDDL